MTKKVIDIFEKKCRRGAHPALEIYRDGYENHEIKVVRWCPICGTVVIDIDYDERTYAGAVMSARRPEIYEIAKDSLEKKG